MLFCFDMKPVVSNHPEKSSDQFFHNCRFKTCLIYNSLEYVDISNTALFCLGESTGTKDTWHVVQPFYRTSIVMEETFASRCIVVSYGYVCDKAKPIAVLFEVKTSRNMEWDFFQVI